MRRRIHDVLTDLRGGFQPLLFICLLAILLPLMPSFPCEANAASTVRAAIEKKVENCHQAVKRTRNGAWITMLSGYKPSPAALSALKTAIIETEKKGCTLGFVLIDINSARGISFRPDRLFYSASTIKGPYAASIVSLNPGIQISGNALLSRTLIWSDNASYNLLTDRYGTAPIRLWFLQAGLAFQGVTQSPNVRFSMYYSPRTLCRLWLRNYSFFQTEARGRELEVLFRTPNRSAIHEVLGSRYRTDSKAGWYPDGERRTANDAGIVYAPSGPYVLALMSTLPADMDSLHRLVYVLNEMHKEMTAIQ